MLGMDGLTEEQRAFVAPLIREPERRRDRKECPPKDARYVLDGILWVLRTGSRWQDSPAVAIDPTRPVIDASGSGAVTAR